MQEIVEWCIDFRGFERGENVSDSLYRVVLCVISVYLNIFTPWSETLSPLKKVKYKNEMIMLSDGEESLLKNQ